MKALRWLLEKIDSLAGKIPLDFTLHFIVSAGMAWVFMVALGLVGCSCYASLTGGFVLSLSVGVSKECIVDAKIKGTQADMLDLAADVFGSFVGVSMGALATLVW
jgi:uncharacterized protein YfiM (DUF2279 family)